jgi:hypothetical protein
MDATSVGGRDRSMSVVVMVDSEDLMQFVAKAVAVFLLLFACVGVAVL